VFKLSADHLGSRKGRGHFLVARISTQWVPLGSLSASVFVARPRTGRQAASGTRKKWARPQRLTTPRRKSIQRLQTSLPCGILWGVAPDVPELTYRAIPPAQRRPPSWRVTGGTPASKNLRRRPPLSRGMSATLAWLKDKIEEFPRRASSWPSPARRCVSGTWNWKSPTALPRRLRPTSSTSCPACAAAATGRRCTGMPSGIFRSWEASRVELHVSPTNRRAFFVYYRKLGYRPAAARRVGPAAMADGIETRGRRPPRALGRGAEILSPVTFHTTLPSANRGIEAMGRGPFPYNQAADVLGHRRQGRIPHPGVALPTGRYSLAADQIPHHLREFAGAEQLVVGLVLNAPAFVAGERGGGWCLTGWRRPLG